MLMHSAGLMGRVARGDKYFANVSLLLHGNGSNGGTTFPDSSLNNFTVTAVGSAQTSTAQSKFKGSSVLFGNSGDALNIASPSSSGPLDLSSGDLTIEFFARRTALSGIDALFVWGDDSPTSYGAEIFFNNSAIQVNRNTSTGILNVATGMTVATWHHFCIRRSGNTWSVHRDGTQLQSTTSANGLDFVTTRFRVGGTINYTANGSLNGYLAEVRITKGVARSVEVPVFPYPDGM